MQSGHVRLRNQFIEGNRVTVLLGLAHQLEARLPFCGSHMYHSCRQATFCLYNQRTLCILGRFSAFSGTQPPVHSKGYFLTLWYGFYAFPCSFSAGRRCAARDQSLLWNGKITLALLACT